MITAEQLTYNAIEKLADKLREDYIRDTKSPLTYGFDAEKYLDYLVGQGMLSNYDFTSQHGLNAKTLGKFIFYKKEIYIYEEPDDEDDNEFDYHKPKKQKNHGRENFTIAHEIGHLILHYPLYFAKYYSNGSSFDLKELTFTDNSNTINGYTQGNENIDRLEFQANYFAACLLMPTLPLKYEFSKLCKVHRLDLGCLYFEDYLSIVDKTNKTPYDDYNEASSDSLFKYHNIYAN